MYEWSVQGPGFGPNPKKVVVEEKEKRKIKLKKSMLNRTNLSCFRVLNRDFRSAEIKTVFSQEAGGTQWECVCVCYHRPAFYFTITWHVLIISHTLSVISIAVQGICQISGGNGIGSPYIRILIDIKTFPVLREDEGGCSLPGEGTIVRESAG